MQEIDHHFETFIRVVDDQVLFPDCGKTIPVMFKHTFGIARRVARKFQIRAVFGDHIGEARDTDHAFGLDDGCALGCQLFAQQFFGHGIEIAVQFQLDHLSAPPPLDGRTECADKILCFFLDFDIAVPKHAKRAVALNREAGKQMMGKAADQAFHADIDRPFARHPDKTRQGRRDQDHFDHLFAIAVARQGEQHPDPLVRNEGKRMRGIDHLRGNDRGDFLQEIGFERDMRARIHPPAIGNLDSRLFQCAAQGFPAFLLLLVDRPDRFPDCGKLLCRAAAIN